MAELAVEYDADYLLRHRRADEMVQKMFPQPAVLMKERFFAWAQSLYLCRMCEFIDPNALYDIGLIKPGLPFLASDLQSNGLSALSLDDQLDLLIDMEEETGVSYCDIKELSNIFNLQVPDRVVGISVTHNLLQKARTIEEVNQLIHESMRIANDFAYHQVTDSESIHFGHDRLHRIDLTVQEWTEIFKKAAEEQGDGWQLRDVHYVKGFDVVDLGRPPVFILERGDHTQKTQSLQVPLSTRLGQKILDETTLANLLSMARPATAHYGLMNFMDDPIKLSISLAAAFSFDAIDGLAARKLGGKDTFFKSTAGTYVDIFADRALELEALWVYAANGMISPVIPAIYTAKGILVDSTRIIKDSKRGDFTKPLSYGNNINRLQRAAYGAVKALYIVGVPILPDAVNTVTGTAMTAMGLYRGAKSLLNTKD